MLSNIKYYEEKKRLLFVFLIIFILLFFAAHLFQVAYSTYQTRVKLNANIDRALYVFESGSMSFNLDNEQLIPSNNLYTYKFSISNFNDTKHSDINTTYSIKILTTTNLPLNYKLYRNQNYDDANANNVLDISKVSNDVDGAWYNVFSPSDNYTLSYDKDITDVYTLAIEFPSNYSENLEYADGIDNISISVESKQIIE